MKQVEPSRINTEFRDQVSASNPIMGRKYTMTHSDDTAQLFVTIGTSFAKDKIGSMRDEVLLGFEPRGQRIQLFGTVLIDSEKDSVNSEKRNEIFLREMPIALQAIRYADRKLFELNPYLDQVPIVIWFQSMNPKYNKIYNFGTMKEYRMK